MLTEEKKQEIRDVHDRLNGEHGFSESDEFLKWAHDNLDLMADPSEEMQAFIEELNPKSPTPTEKLSYVCNDCCAVSTSVIVPPNKCTECGCTRFTKA